MTVPAFEAPSVSVTSSDYHLPHDSPRPERLRFEWEIEIVKGEEGRLLRLEQARAIKALILSLDAPDDAHGGDHHDEEEAV